MNQADIDAFREAIHSFDLEAHERVTLANRASATSTIGAVAKIGDGLLITTPAERRTVFFTAAVGPHEIFALPLIYSVLVNNEDFAIEILVRDADSFLRENRAALEFIDRQDRICIRSIECDDKDAPYMRFLVEPHTKSPHVYIGDVDILILDNNITDVHLDNCERLGLPYSNIVRPSGDRLSGLHFTRWDAYYPIDPLPPSVLKRMTDEHALHEIIRRRKLPFPTGTFRPQHGIHFSPRRTEILSNPTTPSWGVNKATWRAYQRFAKETQWREFLAFTDPSYQKLVGRLEEAAAAL